VHRDAPERDAVGTRLNGRSLAGRTRTRAATSRPGKLTLNASAPDSSFTDAVLNPFCCAR
jgi:hypothetical protein